MQLNGKVKRATFQKLFFHTINMTTETRNVVIAISQLLQPLPSNITLG
jgi:hypothetical protein